MSKLYLMVGNIGSGKTTWIKDNIKDMDNTVVISGDHIRKMLVPGEYTFNPEYEAIIWREIYNLAEGFMDKYIDVIIDCCAITKYKRKQWLQIADKYDYEVVAIVLPKISMKESIKRRLSDNHGDTPAHVWKDVYTNFDQSYDEPTLKEGFSKLIYRDKVVEPRKG